MKEHPAKQEEGFRDSQGQPNPAHDLEIKTIAAAQEREKEKAAAEQGALKQDTHATQVTHRHEKVNYDEKTVAELKEIAAKRGLDISWDARKDEIVSSLEKDDKKASKA